MSDELPKHICENCNEEYEYFMHSNFNLGLCPKCYDKLDKDDTIKHDEWVDTVTHKIICPKCNAIYDMIVDQKCETKDCNVWFFWDELDCKVFARWKEYKKEEVKE